MLAELQPPMLRLQNSGGAFVPIVWIVSQVGSLIDHRTWGLLPKWGQKLGYLVGKHTKPVVEMLWGGKQTFPFLGFWWASSQCASIKTGQIVGHGCLLAHTCGVFAHFCQFAPHKTAGAHFGVFLAGLGKFGIWKSFFGQFRRHMQSLSRLLQGASWP